MTRLLILLGLCPVHGIVDRVEGEWAVVEWSDRSFSDLPVALFSDPPREGAHLRACTPRHPRGAWQPRGDRLVTAWNGDFLTVPHVGSGSGSRQLRLHCRPPAVWPPRAPESSGDGLATQESAQGSSPGSTLQL